MFKLHYNQFFIRRIRCSSPTESEAFIHPSGTEGLNFNQSEMSLIGEFQMIVLHERTTAYDWKQAPNAINTPNL
jgi:hypothetical protein